MAQHVLLNNIDHMDLRVDATRGAAFGDDVMFAITFPSEFRNVQAYYPIVFRKTDDGAFQPIALFGFQEGQNLFLDGNRWNAAYVPLAIERQPFLIGRDGDALLVHIDLDNPRVSSDRGEALFRDQGGTTAFLERMTSVLLALHDGLQATSAFVQALLQHGLLESFALDVELGDGTLNRLEGFYTVNEEKLGALDGPELKALQRAGFLEPLYMVVASLSRFRDLIDRTSRVHAGGR